MSPSIDDRRKRIDGWGFVGESFLPSDALLAWLEERIGATEKVEDPGLPAKIEPPASVPDLGAPTSTNSGDRLSHARGQGLPDILRMRTGRLGPLPDAVVRPGSDDEVEAILEACRKHDAVLVPWGGGTSVTGGVNTPSVDRPVVVLDLGRLRRLEDLDKHSGLAVFEAGAKGPAVEEALAHHGLTLGHYPQSWELSTVGGWIAARSSGQQSLGYGRIEDMVAGVDLVTPEGRLVLPARPASAAGPDLRHLVLGSEGRMGIITRATLRVRPRPDVLEVEAALLPDWPTGLGVSRELMHRRVDLTMLRLSDGPETQVALTTGIGDSPFAPLVRGWLRLRGIGEGASLMLFGADGRVDGVERAIDETRTVISRHGGVALGRGPGRHWLADRFRHPYLRDALLDRGVATDTLETAGTWSQLEALSRTIRVSLEKALEDEGERVAVLCHLSHPYSDGASLYFTFFYRRQADPDATLEFWTRLKRSATAMLATEGATVSHHHGVGRWHAPWLETETSTVGHSVLVNAASHLDPEGILNPQVLLDPVDRLEE